MKITLICRCDEVSGWTTRLVASQGAYEDLPETSDRPDAKELSILTICSPNEQIMKALATLQHNCEYEVTIRPREFPGEAHEIVGTVDLSEARPGHPAQMHPVKCEYSTVLGDGTIVPGLVGFADPARVSLPDYDPYKAIPGDASPEYLAFVKKYRETLLQFKREYLNFHPSQTTLDDLGDVLCDRPGEV